MNRLLTSKLFPILVLIFFITILNKPLHAQVFNGDLVLTAQAQVDFMALTNYTSISGDLLIVNGADITNLDGLSQITEVGGVLDIFNNPLLISITGLSNLTSVGANAQVPADGSMSIVNNNALVSLAGLSNLTAIHGPLFIYDNDVLLNLDALSGLNNFSYFLQISGNPFLLNINGLQGSLNNIIDGISIFNNQSLATINALQDVQRVFGDLTISDNPLLPNLSALSNMINVGDLEITDNAALTDFTGLNNIADHCGLVSYVISGNGAEPPAALIARFDACLANTKPVADAGDDAEVIQNALVQLDGSGSYDADGNSLTYTWNIIFKPTGSNAALSNSSIVNPSFTADLTGTYTIQLTVYDGFHNSLPDQVIITAITINQAIQEPIAEINQLPLGGGVKNSLKSKLQNALKSYSEGNINAAINQLMAFLNQLNNLVADGSLTQAQAQPLIDYVTNLIAMLNTMLKESANGFTQIPDNYELSQNYPNPFNPSTVIKWHIPENSFISLKVYDAAGSEVKTLVNGNFAAGSYETQFNSSGLASGIYYYRIIAGSFIETRKMILLK